MPLDFSYIKNPLRNDPNILKKILRRIAHNVVANHEKIDSFEVEEMDDNILRKKYYDIGETYMDKYKVTFKIKSQKQDKKVIYKIHIPKIFNKCFTVIHGVSRINLFQLIDGPLIKLPDKNKVKFWNNVVNISFTAKEDKKDKKASIKAFVSKRFSSYNLMSFLFEKYGSVNAFLNHYYPDNEFTFKTTKLEAGKNLGSIMEYDPTVLTDNKFKYIFDYTPYKDVDDINKIDSWRHMNGYYHKKSFLEHLRFIISIDIFSPACKKGLDILDDIFIAITNPGSMKDKYDINFKRIRSLEVLFKPIIKNFAELLYITYKTRNKEKVEKTVDVCAKIVTEPLAKMLQIVQEEYTPIHIIGEKSKIQLYGPDSFDPKNVPVDLRNIQPSYENKLCCVATPDSDKVGVVEYFNYGSELFD